MQGRFDFSKLRPQHPAVTGIRYMALLPIVMAIESIVFYAQVAINVAPFYPPNHDQTSYLIEAYGLVTNLRGLGIGASLGTPLLSHAPNGAIFPLQGALVSLILGVSRAGVLSLNLLVFLLLQAVTFRLVKWKTNHDSDAWVAAALVLLLNSPFFFAGGIFDFRIDFFALCIFGIWACTVLRAGVFRSLRWSIVAGLIGGWLACTRYISVVYLVPILGVLFLVNVISWLTVGTRFRGAASWLRARNLIISSILTIGLVSPLLWSNRNAIYNYYFVSMFLNDEGQVRAQQYGIQSLWQHLWFYPKSVLFDHLGTPLLFVCGAMLISACICAWRQAEPIAPWRGIRYRRHSLLFLGTAILVPLLLLNLSVHKSPVIAGILCAPIVLLVVILRSAIGPYDGIVVGRPSKFAERWKNSIGFPQAIAALITAAMLVFMYRAGGPKVGLQYDERLVVNDIYDKMLRYATEAGNASPSMSVDAVLDYLHAGALTVASYERSGRLIHFREMLANGIFARNRAEALALAARSDIAVLTDPVLGREQPYPFNSAIREYWDELRSMVSKDFVPLTTATIRGVPLAVFVKPSVKITGASGEWVTSAGLLIEAKPDEIARWPYVVLEGDALYDALGGEPLPQAVALGGTSRSNKELPVTFKRDGSRYLLIINATFAPASAPGGSVKIRLTFDKFFVPSTLGTGPDTRELVVLAPFRRELRSAPNG